MPTANDNLNITGEVYEDSTGILLGLLTADGGSGAAAPDATYGNLVQQADVSSITVRAYASDGSQNGTTQTPVIADCIYDTIQTTGILSQIPGGGNFVFSCPTSFFPLGGDQVTVEIAIVLVDGTVVNQGWLIDVAALQSS